MACAASSSCKFNTCVVFSLNIMSSSNSITVCFLHPSGPPSSKPSYEPSSMPSGHPSGPPSSKPSNEPSSIPSGHPSGPPSSKPSNEPSSIPRGHPSACSCALSLGGHLYPHLELVLL